MFRFLLGFIYVVYILLKSSNSASSSSSSVLASFNESCSHNFSCANPLICSNINRCICSNSSLFWNNEQNDCLYCLPGWIEWENNRCVSLAVPSEGGLPYNQANDICHSFSAQLFRIKNIDEFNRFELQANKLLHSTYTSAVTIFFRVGAWIDGLNMEGLEDIWCNENESISNSECMFIRRKNLKNGSLCLSRLNCNEEILFICDMAAVSEKYIFNDANQRLAPLIGVLAPLAIDLVGNLFGGNKQPQQPTGPQHIIIQQESVTQPQVAAQGSSSDNILLFVGLAIGGFVLLLIICGAFIAIILFVGCRKNPSSNQPTNHRSSVESGLSYG